MTIGVQLTLVDELQMNFGKDTTDPVIQGAKTFLGPMKEDLQLI